MRAPAALQREPSAEDQAAFAAALLDPGLPCPAGLRAWNGSDPGVRFAVHRNNVVSGLIDALADSFPVVQQLVGEPFFRAMAAVFVRESPPRSAVLALCGADFPAFIAGFAPAASLPYLADVARLEAARVRAFHAADAAPPGAEMLSRALDSGERLGELHIGCHPSLAVVVSAFALVSVWAAHQGEAEVQPFSAEGPECALVLREGLEVQVLKVPAGTACFVSALQQGLDLGSAAAAATAAASDDAGQAFDLTATLSLLLQHGALTSFELPPER